MLNPRKRMEKDYTQIMEDIYSEIPIYSEEWTNYNPSDPGITILENLMAFQLLQYQQLDETSDKVKQQLLKMSGFEPHKGSGARVLLEPVGLQNPLTLPANQKFYVGDMSFETSKEKVLPGCHIVGLYAKHQGKLKDYSFVLDPEITIPAAIFGDVPEIGDEFYIVMDSLPEAHTETVFYAKSAQYMHRNPLGEKEHNRFARIEWECYTADGFVPMNVKDDTECFLLSGEIRFRIPEQEAAVYEEQEIQGYVFRGTLRKAQYDVAPRLQQMSGFLFEVLQKDTQSLVYMFPKSNVITIQSDLMAEGHYKIFCKEEKGNTYRLYEEVWDDDTPGRFYTVHHIEGNTYEIHFDKRKYKYAPARVKNAVMIVLYNRTMMRKYYLGDVLGYDNQEIELPAKNLISDAFSILALRYDENGEPIYNLVKPNRTGEDEISYYLFENEGKIRIQDAGDYIGAKLYLASIAVTEGENGNIREYNQFSLKGNQETEVIFRNPAPGKGGRFMESLEDTRKRYVQDIYRPYTAVTAKDYEELIKCTPGLCIHKVKAYMNPERNCVEVAVKPYATERFPVLSQDYLTILNHQINQCRLLSTRVTILQPVYLPIHVQGVIYVKQHYERCEEQIREVLENELDYINGEQEFGQVLSFDQIFRKLEQLECVSHIYDLSFSPQTSGLAVKQGVDIVPKPNCLCYPGTMSIDIRTYEIES